jgi:hypothetical protein
VLCCIVCDVAYKQEQQITLRELSANRPQLLTGSLKSLSSVRKVWKPYHAVLADSSLYLYDSNAVPSVDLQRCAVLTRASL